MKKIVVILLLLTLPLLLYNGCSKKQEVEQKMETEEIEKAPVDTTATPDTTAGEAAEESTPK